MTEIKGGMSRYPTGTCIECHEDFPWARGSWTCCRCLKKYPSTDGRRGRPRLWCSKCYAKRPLKKRKFCSSPCARRWHGKAQYRKDPDVQREKDLQRKYGIGCADYAEMLAEQGGNCGICEAHPGARRLAVDHNAQTGLTRGLLCGKCNMGIGSLQHEPWLLRAAADYLEKHGGPRPRH